ncbi:MAG: hypothetical protein KAV42_03580 [Candidatus Krumholzibacteria bacterium]|nr:hypothetical protein [Candidatus Krumholzibacteria bacterium]
MNRISFHGSTHVIKDFADRFLDSPLASFEPLEETVDRYGTQLGEIASSMNVDIRCLEKIVDFMVSCDLPDSRIRVFLEGDSDELKILVRDVQLLEEYVQDGTILDVRVVDEL